MTRRIKPATRISLELIIGRKKKFMMKGSCLDEKPAMPVVFKAYTFMARPDMDENLLKKLLYESTLHKKESLLTSYANKNCAGKPYEIRRRVWKE